MDNSDLICIMAFMCVFTFIGTVALVVGEYEERVSNLEYELVFMKLDLSCEKSARENILSNYLTTPRQDSLIDKVNDWYLREC